MKLIGRIFGNRKSPTPAEEPTPNTSEAGVRTTEERRLEALYQTMYADPELRMAIYDIRQMHARDGRVKKIHGRTARAMTKGGLRIEGASGKKRIHRLFADYVTRLGLNNRAKLESDARGCMMEGNLPMQWVVDQTGRVVKGVRMPTETIRPNVGENGQFVDPRVAYEQWDYLKGKAIAGFALWQMTLGRLSPGNIDDMGSMGRPYLDASREVWRKLTMTEEDLVIRRRERAPMRTAHFLEGATEEELDKYREQIEADQTQITTNFYSNRKGSVQAVQGDANLDQIADVAHLLDTFFSGAPAPKGLFGYVSDLNRDILDDLKQDFFDELDALQDTVAWVYEQGFRLDLLLRGINPDSYDFRVIFSERLTETLNQRADRGLKLQALGASRRTTWETAGLNPEEEIERLEDEADADSPYPSEHQIGGNGGTPSQPRISITPGNRRKGESGTSVSN